MTGTLIPVTELDRQLGEVTLLDVHYRLGGPPGRPEFEAGHVPGAAYVDLSDDLADSSGPRGRHPLPETDVFVSAMRRAACGRGTRWWSTTTGRAAPALLVAAAPPRRRPRARRGWSAWLAAGGEVETGPERPRATGDLVGEPGEMPVVDSLSAMGVSVLVVARAPERYRGETEPVDPVAGDVSGAVNVPTADNLDESGQFRSPETLRAAYAGVGVTPGVDVAAYCGSGVTACHDLLALEVVGLRGALSGQLVRVDRRLVAAGGDGPKV